MTGRISEVLVTGGAGFIGSHIADRLVNDGLEVTVLDSLSSGRMENLSKSVRNKNLRFLKGDIRDWGFVKKAVKDIDAVFHEAALVSVARSVKEPLLTNDVNVIGTLNVLKASSDCGVKRFVFASSAAVYGNNQSTKIKEDVALNPLSPYGVSKVTGEFYAKYFYNVQGLETISLRYFNAYGPRQSFDPQSPYSGVISIFLNQLFGNSSPVVLGDGEQTRDFVYVSDIVEANILALNNKNASGQVLNVGSGRSVSINQVAEILKKVLDKACLPNEYRDPRPGDIRHSCADIERAKSLLGYEPRFSLDKGIQELVEWYSHSRSLYE